MFIPEVPFDTDEDLYPIFRAAQRLRRMGVEPVLVEPDSPAQELSQPAYYVPAGYFRPGTPAVVVVREDLEDDGSGEEAALFRGATHHAAVRLGLAPPDRILVCDPNASPCSARDQALLRREVASWWTWWSPRHHAVSAAATR